MGKLDGERQLRDLPLNTADGMIAARALEHGLTLVTRNVKDFAAAGSPAAQYLRSAMTTDVPVPLPALIVPKSGLTSAQFADLADVPPELEWLANMTNAKTRRAYKVDVAEFFAFTHLKDHSALRTVTRAHIIAWRKDLESRSLAPTSIRRKLSALSSFFDYLCERNAVIGNPVDGVKHPVFNNNEGSTPALGDAQVRRLLEAPPRDTLKGVRDRAILVILLYHGIRREELCLLRLRDLQSRQGVMHFRVHGKRDKIRFVPVHPMALRLIGEYLEAGKQAGGEPREHRLSPLSACGEQSDWRPDTHLDPGSIYRNIVMKYAKATGINGEAIGVYAFNARKRCHECPFQRGGHRQDGGVAGPCKRLTTRLYDRRKTRPGIALRFM